jgi:hypothetical protein
MCIHGTNCMNPRNAIIFTTVPTPQLQFLEIYNRPKSSLYENPSIQGRRYRIYHQSRKLFMSTPRICSCNSSNGRHDVKEAPLQMRALCGLNLDSGTSVENLRDVISKQILSSTLFIASTAFLRSAAYEQAAQHRKSH